MNFLCAIMNSPTCLLTSPGSFSHRAHTRVGLVTLDKNRARFKLLGCVLFCSGNTKWHGYNLSSEPVRLRLFWH